MGNLLYLVDLDPQNIFYRTQLARTYLNLGWPDEAMKEFAKVLVIDPNNKEAKDMLRNQELTQ